MSKLGVLKVDSGQVLKNGDIVVATSDFSTKAKGFLPLKKDDIIQVEGLSNSVGWYIGTCEGRKGMFSTNYVTLITNANQVDPLHSGTPAPPAPSVTSTKVRPSMAAASTAVLATIPSSSGEPTRKPKESPEIHEEDDGEPVNWDKVFTVKNMFVAGAVMSLFKRYNIGGLGESEENSEDTEEK